MSRSAIATCREAQASSLGSARASRAVFDVPLEDSSCAILSGSKSDNWEGALRRFPDIWDDTEIVLPSLAYTRTPRKSGLGGTYALQSIGVGFARASPSVSSFFSRALAACRSRNYAYSARVFASNSGRSCSLSSELTTPTARDASTTCTVLAP